jgi:hypothetical protein
MIPLGYEIGTGRRVSVPLGHTIVLGQTQKSGKTTTLEAMTARSGVKAIAFITKRGEKSFRLAQPIPPYYSETSETQPYWQFVVSIIESSHDVRLGFREKGWVMELCTASGLNYSTETESGKKKKGSATWKEPKTLREVLTNAELALKHSKGVSKMICRQLVEYLKVAVPEIERARLSSSLELKPGINVMDISTLSLPVQMLIIRSVLEWCIRRRKIVVIIPEAWKFLPEGHTTPVSGPAIAFIREGAVNQNFMWIDLQDLRGIQKMLLRSVQVWLFGVQREKNEVENTLRSMPTPDIKPTAQEMMQLRIGEFLVCYDTFLYRTYVQPAGMEDVHAQAIARGDERPESWGQIVRSLDAETKSPQKAEPPANDDEQEPVGSADDDRAVAQLDQPEAGSARAAEGDAPGVDPNSDREDAMYREKYEEFKHNIAAALAIAGRPRSDEDLITSVHTLRMAHDSLAERIRASEAAGETVLYVDPLAAVDLTPDALKHRVNALVKNGEFEAIYRYIVDRARKDPGILQLLQTQPELQVNVVRETLAVDSKTMQGGIAILIRKGFFDRPTTAAAVCKELRRLGYAFKDATIAARCNELVAAGFLTREDSGYLVVPDMKVNLVEARA